VKLRNFARLVFTTNNVLCAKITDTSRRYVIYEVSNEKIGNKEYFTGFAKYMRDVRNQKAMMKYLRERDISQVNWINDRPISETYEALKSLGADPLLKFLSYVWELHRREESVLMSSSELLKEFHAFLKDKLKMKDEAINIWNFKMFGLRMGNYCKGDDAWIEKRSNIGKHKLRGYWLNVEGLKGYLEKKGLLCEEMYMITSDSEDNLLD
jgi:hypothetical protein